LKNASYFSEVEFNNFKRMLQTFKAEDENFPIFRRLDKINQDFIRNVSREQINVIPQIRTDLIKDLNNMLTDRQLSRICRIITLQKRIRKNSIIE